MDGVSERAGGCGERSERVGGAGERASGWVGQVSERVGGGRVSEQAGGWGG